MSRKTAKEVKKFMKFKKWQRQTWQKEEKSFAFLELFQKIIYLHLMSFTRWHFDFSSSLTTFFLLLQFFYFFFIFEWKKKKSFIKWEKFKLSFWGFLGEHNEKYNVSFDFVRRKRKGGMMMSHFKLSPPLRTFWIEKKNWILFFALYSRPLVVLRRREKFINSFA